MFIPVQGLLEGTLYGNMAAVPPFANSSFSHSSTRFSAYVMFLISVVLARVNIVCVKGAQIAEAQFAVATKFYKVTPSICVAILAPGILRWLLDFFKNLWTSGSVIFLWWLLAYNFPELRLSLHLSLGMLWKIVLAPGYSGFAWHFDVDTKLLLLLLLLLFLL